MAVEKKWLFKVIKPYRPDFVFSLDRNVGFANESAWDDIQLVIQNGNNVYFDCRFLSEAEDVSYFSAKFSELSKKVYINKGQILFFNCASWVKNHLQLSIEPTYKLLAPTMFKRWYSYILSAIRG